MVNNRFKLIGGAVIVSLVTAVTLAFTEVADSEEALATQWYSLDITGPDPEEFDNQKITGILPGEPASPDCNVTNTSDPCAVQLDSPNPLPSGITVQEALDQHNATFSSGEDYAREQ